MSKQFAEFQLHDVFYIESSIRLKSADHIPGNTPFISSRSGNNGISAWVGNMNESLDSDVLGVNYNGSVLEAYYHPYKALFSDDVKRFKIRQPGVTFRAYLYCATAIRKLKEAYSYTKKFNGDEIDVARIKLPIADVSVNTDTPEPDWEYMENYIKTIERKYIDQIAQVNAREQEILTQLYPESVTEKPEAHGFEEFRVGDLFEIKGSNSTDAGTLHLTNDNSFPFIGRTSINNGIQGFCENLGFPANDAGEISISQVGTIDAQWRETPYYTSQNIVRCRAKDTTLTRRSGLYVTAILKKHLSGFIGYTTPKVADIMDFEIKLPITNPTTKTPNPEPDWDYMENYIAWIETQERESRKLRATRDEQILNWLHQQH